MPRPRVGVKLFDDGRFLVDGVHGAFGTGAGHGCAQEHVDDEHHQEQDPERDAQVGHPGWAGAAVGADRLHVCDSGQGEALGRNQPFQSFPKKTLTHRLEPPVPGRTPSTTPSPRCPRAAMTTRQLWASRLQERRRRLPRTCPDCPTRTGPWRTRRRRRRPCPACRLPTRRSRSHS